MTSRGAGEAAEERAERYLKRQGFRTLQRNFRVKTGEIDLIMTRAELLIFVEVRLRNNPSHGSGAESVDHVKRRKIINTARWFLQRHGNSSWRSYRFDVVSISSGINWIPGAFTLD